MTLSPGLQAIRERAEKATAGPWCAENVGEKSNEIIIGIAYAIEDDQCQQQLGGWPEFYDEAGEDTAYRDASVCVIEDDCVNVHHDADFIAAARTDVPALLDLIEEMAGALEKHTERLPCQYNDRGYCQTHGCERPCKVEVNRAALDKYREFK